jgi:hypothetical protein
MTSSFRFGWLLISNWLLSLSVVRAQSSPTLTLTIIPSSYSSQGSSKPEILFSNRGHFHVLLTNVSPRPVTLFEEWNSWGYYGLSFEITYSDGRKVLATRGPRGWDKNFPSTFTVAPQGYYVFEVSFDRTWTFSPRAESKSGDSVTCQLRAIYSVERQKGDEELVDPGAPAPWVGTVGSQEATYLLWP